MWSSSWTLRRRRTATYLAISLLFLVSLSLVHHDLRRDHYLNESSLRRLRALYNTFPGGKQGSNLDTLCKDHGFSAWHKPSRKVYDLFLFNTELEWLEIRLNTLAPYVDYFVIVESPHTFSAHPKPLYLAEEWDRFRAFHDKIIYRNVTLPKISGRLWDNEDYLRNSLLRSVFPSLIGTEQEAHTGDVLAVSDIDEIIRPETMMLLRHCGIPGRLTLRSKFYKSSFQWLHRGPQWPRPQVTTFRGSVSNTVAPNDLRMDLLGGTVFLHPWDAMRRWWDRATLWNAGWHCTSCFSTIQEVHTKMHSFSHQFWNTPVNRAPQTIIARVRNGTDQFGRDEEQVDRVAPEEMDVPEYVLQHYRDEGRFKYLVDRDAEGAGFEDWEVMLEQYHEPEE